MRNNENSFKTIAKTSSSSSYLGFTILLCKYGLPYLPTLPQKNLSKLFFWKKFGSKIPYLPTVWTYVQSFVVFLFGTLSLEKLKILSNQKFPNRSASESRWRHFTTAHIFLLVLTGKKSILCFVIILLFCRNRWLEEQHGK